MCLPHVATLFFTLQDLLRSFTLIDKNNYIFRFLSFCTVLFAVAFCPISLYLFLMRSLKSTCYLLCRQWYGWYFQQFQVVITQTTFAQLHRSNLVVALSFFCSLHFSYAYACVRVCAHENEFCILMNEFQQ